MTSMSRWFRGAAGVGLECRRTLRERSLLPVSTWGVLGSGAIPLRMGTDASMELLTEFLGAVVATASVDSARRGVPSEPRVGSGNAPLPWSRR